MALITHTHALITKITNALGNLNLDAIHISEKIRLLIAKMDKLKISYNVLNQNYINFVRICEFKKFKLRKP